MKTTHAEFIEVTEPFGVAIVKELDRRELKRTVTDAEALYKWRRMPPFLKAAALALFTMLTQSGQLELMTEEEGTDAVQRMSQISQADYGQTREQAKELWDGFTPGQRLACFGMWQDYKRIIEVQQN